MDGDGSLVPPGAFIPSAERFHLMGGVDRWVVRHAIAWLQGLLECGDAPSVAINLSGQSVGDRSFHSWAIDAFTAADSARQAQPALAGELCGLSVHVAAIAA